VLPRKVKDAQAHARPDPNTPINAHTRIHAHAHAHTQTHTEASSPFITTLSKPVHLRKDGSWICCYPGSSPGYGRVQVLSQGLASRASPSRIGACPLGNRALFEVAVVERPCLGQHLLLDFREALGGKSLSTPASQCLASFSFSSPAKSACDSNHFQHLNSFSIFTA
jgi:hypothetical protein